MSHDGAVVYFTPKCTVTKRRGTVFVHQFQLMTLETFQAVKFGGSKGWPGASAASWGGIVCRALEDGSGKDGEPKASGAERAGNIDHTAITVNHSKARRTRQVVDTGPALTNFSRIPYWRNCTFT